MATTFTTRTVTTSHQFAPSTPSLRRTTLAVGVVAAAVTTAVAAAVHAAGIPLEVSDGEIPLAGFAEMTFLGAILGGIILAVLNRRSSAPRRRLAQTTVTLTALSCIPSIALAPAVATKVALVAMHLIAAAIIVPVLARRANG